MNPLRVIHIPVKGFNMSLVKTSTGYAGTLRRQTILPLRNPRYPEVENTLIWLDFTPDFLLVSVRELKDGTTHTKHMNFTRGPEDVRLVTSSQGLGVSLDTNGQFRIEMALVDLSSTELKKVTPLQFAESQRAEKNWILLRCVSPTRWHLLYSANPIKVLELDTLSGNCQVFTQHPTPLHESTHNGAAVCLPTGQYLVAVRSKQGHSYLHSRFMLLDATYAVLGFSEPFRFLYSDEYRNDDGTYRTGPYEMCMSLWIEGDVLYASVSINDATNYILEYSLEGIVKKLIQSVS